MARKIGSIIDSHGKVVGEALCADSALSEDADLLSQGLYILSRALILGLFPDQPRGFLGGEFGYGVDYENDVFMMHHYCWCEKNDGSCLWCIHGDNPQFMALLNRAFGTTDETYYNKKTHYFDPPHFWHKPSNLRVCWYKWIGRDMAINRELLTRLEWKAIWDSCMESLPPEARAVAPAPSR